MDHYIAILLVIAAAIYLILHFRSQFNTSKGCASGCDSCPSIDWKKMEKKMKKDTAKL